MDWSSLSSYWISATFWSINAEQWLRKCCVYPHKLSFWHMYDLYCNTGGGYFQFDYLAFISLRRWLVDVEQRCVIFVENQRYVHCLIFFSSSLTLGETHGSLIEPLSRSLPHFYPLPLLPQGITGLSFFCF